MKTWVDKLLLGLHVTGAIVSAALAVLIVYDVIGRLAFNRPFSGTAEIAAVALVFLTYLQTPHAIHKQKLLRVTALVDRLPEMGRRLCTAFAYCLGATFFIAIAVTSWEPLQVALATSEFFGSDAFRVPAWPLRIFTLVIWIVTAMVCLGLAIHALRTSSSLCDPSDEYDQH
ncbi:MAG TPA: TRAP transporter small permease [Paenalcaligenes sp.]|nr:TRAP transporter small permease [Paenalcaligenes sp.]